MHDQPDSGDVLREAHLAGKLDQFQLTEHALAEAKEANARHSDIRNALKTAKAALFQSENGRWKLVGGTDIEGVELKLIIELRHGVLIVTVF